ncbi:MAG: TylF/MycF family methyltransferase [Patescibacteria group bacterium]|nr:TylF/MycF family methyltransferase [Patescibacteria group bacterium]
MHTSIELEKEAQELGISLSKVLEIVEKVRPYTMVPDISQCFNIFSVIRAIRNKQKGIIVECGAWKGGSGMAMLLAQKEFFGKVIKPVYLLDSFEGLPPAKEIDGPLAKKWQKDTKSPGYYDNCIALIDDVKKALVDFGFSEGDFYLIKGWFDKTVPLLAKKLRFKKIALLRLDGDWYDSTKICLENLSPLVSKGGIVILDDYYAWDGCSIAVHEYLGGNKLSYRIKPIGNFMGAYFYQKSRDIK